MALNDIQLNSALLAEMYRDSLVGINEGLQQNIHAQTREDKQGPEKNDPGTETLVVKQLGSFKKKILFVVRYPGITHLPDEQLSFLTSILAACKLSLADVAIVNLSNVPSATYHDIQEELRSVVTVLFGITPEEFEMPVNFPEFQIQPFNNCTFLHTPVLENLESDKILKSKLWVCLRRIFNLS